MNQISGLADKLQEMAGRIRDLREIIENQDVAAAETKLRSVMTTVEKAVTKGVLHRNTASRYISDFGVAMYCGFGRQPGKDGTETMREHAGVVRTVRR